MEKVIIYGIGNIGKNVLASLVENEKMLDISIVALADKQKVDSLYGYPVFFPWQLNTIEFDYVLVTSGRWYEDICKELIETYNIPKEKIVFWNSLLEGRGEGRYYCNLCGRRTSFMLPYGYESPIFSEKKIVGGGIRKNGMCPFCNSLDRNRWVQYILEQETDIYKENVKILHFAPEHEIEKKLRGLSKGEYITGDIEEGKADRIIDITDIDFPKETFDYILCNHVLEHIKDEKKAFWEIKRCLKADGKVIFSVPMCWDQKTQEGENIDSNEKRLKEYGQEDHVRLYGNDLKERLEKYGFVVLGYKVKEILNKEQIVELGLIEDDTVWILKKDNLV